LLSCSSDDKIDDGEIDGPKHIALNYQASPQGQTGLAGKILTFAITAVKLNSLVALTATAGSKLFTAQYNCKLMILCAQV